MPREDPLGAERPQRLFVAVDVPEAIDAAAEDLAERWRERLGGAGRWVAPENRHVTVAFLGRTSADRVAWVRDRLRDACRSVRPFETRLQELDAMPRPHGARVLWVRLDDGGGGWAALAGAVGNALAEAFTPEQRAYTPHLTLARFDPRVSLSGHQDALREPPDGPAFRVGSVTLFRSHLGRPGPRYEAVERVALGGR